MKVSFFGRSASGWALTTLVALAGSGGLAPAVAGTEYVVKAGYREDGGGFRFEGVPAPAVNDAAAGAKLTLVAGARDRNGAGLEALTDGRLPAGEDDPRANFFFAAGTPGGRIVMDLRRVVTAQFVATYSWHTSTRAPQVYRVYGADGTADGFVAEPAGGADPVGRGWQRLARVDTRPAEGAQAGGGQHGAVITRAGGPLGKFRYLLFDIERTEDRDPFGNTFFSEIDVAEAEGPELVPIPVAAAAVSEPVRIPFSFGDGRYRFTIDATVAPDLAEWAKEKLVPVVVEWYPKIVVMLPSEGFEAPREVTLRFRTDMRGTPASAGGRRVNLNAGWIRRELEREARGAVVHELVHIVQSYGRARRGNRAPGWLVEGMADYIRWFLYEPETRGAEIGRRNLERARYDASYRVTGNFLDWVTREHDKDLLRKLNAAAREGRYAESLWKEWTGKTVQELGAEWKEHHRRRLEGGR